MVIFYTLLRNYILYSGKILHIKAIIHIFYLNARDFYLRNPEACITFYGYFKRKIKHPGSGEPGLGMGTEKGNSIILFKPAVRPGFISFAPIESGFQ